MSKTNADTAEEMKNMGREQEAGEQEGEDETSFTDERRRMNESIPVPDGSNPDFKRVDDNTSTSEGPGGSVPNIGRDVGNMRRSITYDKKRFLKDILDISTNRGDGPSSDELYNKLEIATNKKSGKTIGAKYDGKKVLILKNGKMEYSTDRDNAQHVSDFRDQLKKASNEYKNTPATLIEEHEGVDVTRDTANNVINTVSDEIESEIEDFLKKYDSNKNELGPRNLAGILRVEGKFGENDIKAIEIENTKWSEKANDAKEKGNKVSECFYKSIAEIADMKIDQLRLHMNLKPKSKKVIDMVKKASENSDPVRFEKFRKWAKENLLELSAVAISAAGILTTVIMAGRSALKRGAQAVSKFGKAVANIAKTFGPILSALGTLISKVLTLGAQGILFLAQNLWILVLALTYFIYNEYMSRRGHGSRRRRE